MSGAQKRNSVDVMSRAFDIIMRLQAGERLTARKISELYSCSYRNGYRILKIAIVALPVSVVGGSGMGGEIIRWQRRN